MELFSHISAFLSLIYGLAIAQLLFGFGQLINAGDRVRWFAAHVLWGIGLLVITAVWWWLEFAWSVQGRLSIFSFLFLAAKPCILYFLAVLLLPRVPDNGPIDLERHYWSRFRWIFVLLSLFVLLDLADSAAHGMSNILSLPWYYFVSIGGGVALLSAGAIFRNRGYHILLLVLFLALIFANVILLGRS